MTIIHDEFCYITWKVTGSNGYRCQRLPIHEAAIPSKDFSQCSLVEPVGQHGARILQPFRIFAIASLCRL